MFVFSSYDDLVNYIMDFGCDGYDVAQSLIFKGKTIHEYSLRCEELNNLLYSIENLTNEQNSEIKRINTIGGFLPTLPILIHSQLLNLYNQLTNQNLIW